MTIFNTCTAKEKITYMCECVKIFHWLTGKKGKKRGKEGFVQCKNGKLLSLIKDGKVKETVKDRDEKYVLCTSIFNPALPDTTVNK